MVILYHGTSKENALSITQNGFSLDRSGDNWGNTYGKGVYFSKQLEDAIVYAGNDGVVLMCDLYVKGFHLNRDYSPTERYDRREIKKLIHGLTDYNCLISRDQSEYIFFGMIPRCTIIVRRVIT